MFITVIYFAPIVISIIALIIDLRRGFNKRALVLSAMMTMMIEMLTMRYISNTWYAFIFSIFVPMAVIYTAFSLYISIRTGKEKKEDE